MKQISPLDPKKTEIVMKRFSYSQIADYMKQYPAGVFVEGLNRKGAYWARKRLEKLTGKQIQSQPILSTDRREGYSFRFVNGQKV